MRRDKTGLLLSYSPRKRNPYAENIQQLPPSWFQDHHTYKQILLYLQAKNTEVERMVGQFRTNRYSNLQTTINATLKNICNKVQQWLTTLNQYQLNPTQSIVISNMKKYFISEVTIQSRRLFSIKTRLQFMIQQQLNVSNLNMSHLNQSMNQSYQLNRSTIELNRNQEFIEISRKIQQINSLMKEMNNVVYQQGTMIDRIDENFLEAQRNMKMGNESLKKRLDREEGRDQFSFDGRANKVIMGLYLTNIVLIVIWFIKHIL